MVPCEEELLLLVEGTVRVVLVVVTVWVRDKLLSLLYVLLVVVCPGLLLGRGRLGVEGRMLSFLLFPGTSRHVDLGLPVMAGRTFTGLLKFLLA